VAVVDPHDEVGEIAAHFGAVAVRDFEAEVVILDVGAFLGMGFGDAAELPFPLAVENDPVDVAVPGAGLPAVGAGGVEADVGAPLADEAGVQPLPGDALERVEFPALIAALFGHILADVLPEVAVHGHFVAGNVFSDRDAQDHLAFGLEGVEIVAGAALEQGAPAGGEFEAFAAFEGVVVGDDDLGAFDVIQHNR
jgi:hypothetical protein